MPKNPKKSSVPKTPAAKENSSCCGSKILPLLIAAGVGFLGAFLWMRGCPLASLSCPIYSEACPVTSTLQKVKVALQKDNLTEARAQAEKLGDQLQATMPDLADLAQKLSRARDLAEARNLLQTLEKKMVADVTHPPRK
ncbi:MAG: hypothetical protein EBT57_04105 [Verrucomicrobia bacterium]|nr:hypothetical protein [Verrucomicrobiota bacterium]